MKRIVLSSGDNTIRIWDADSSKHLTGPFKIHTRNLVSESFSRDGTRVLSSSYDTTVRIWDAESGELLAVAFSPDGKHFVSPSCSNTICIRDADSGILVSGPFKGHTSRVNSVGYSPVGKHVVMTRRFAYGMRTVASSSWNRSRVTQAPSTQLHSPRTGNALRRVLVIGQLVSGMPGPEISSRDRSKDVESAPRQFFFSPDGNCVVSGSWDSTICIWDADIGELISGPLEGHTDEIYSVAMSPDGTRIVSGSSDNIIRRLWDVGNEGIVPGCGGRLTRSVVARSSSSHRADPHTVSNDQGTGPAASRERTRSNWTLFEDGWVKDEGGEFLTWIPEDMRGTLCRARNTVVFSCKFSSTKLD